MQLRVYRKAKVSILYTILHNETIPEMQVKAPAHLQVEHISLGYNATLALSDVSFEVLQGTRVAVVGPNGAGKSTLFKALVGLLPARTGRILVHGLALHAHEDCVAYVPQRDEVDWRFPLSVSDVVMMGRYHRIGWFKRPTPADRQIVAECLEQVGMALMTKTHISELSGGQQQRVFLARALAQEPHVLLMDEPFNGVDMGTQEAVLRMLDDLQSRRVTVMIATHDLNLASRYFDRVLLLNKRLLAYGVPIDVMQQSVLTEAFQGQMLVLTDGTVVADQCCP